MTWQTAHKLEQVVITLHLPTVANGDRALIEAVGRASTKRANLWTWSEGWEPDEMHREGYEPADQIHHLLLVALQDRPNSASRLSFGLTGGLLWSEPELPFQ